MENRSAVESAMRQHVALSPMALVEKPQDDDADYEAAIAVIRKTRRASVSHFQINLGWGYNHAARILGLLQSRGIVGARIGPRSYEIVKV